MPIRMILCTDMGRFTPAKPGVTHGTILHQSNSRDNFTPAKLV